jgi:hypothetical protein
MVRGTKQIGSSLSDAVMSMETLDSVNSIISGFKAQNENPILEEN